MRTSFDVPTNLNFLVDMEINHIRQVMPPALREPRCAALLGAAYWDARLTNLLFIDGLTLQQRGELLELRERIYQKAPGECRCHRVKRMVGVQIPMSGVRPDLL